MKEEDFNVLTEIAIQQILKKKLNVDLRKYKILSSFAHTFAYKAIQAKDKIEVAAINPLISLESVKNI